MVKYSWAVAYAAPLVNIDLQNEINLIGDRSSQNFYNIKTTVLANLGSDYGFSHDSTKPLP